MEEEVSNKEIINDLIERWQNWLRVRTEKCKNRETLLNTQDSAIKQMGDEFLKQLNK